MTRREVIAVLHAGAATAVLSACARGPSGKYRFRLTIAVETPQGERTGSSIYEVRARYIVGMDPSGRVSEWTTRGEAVVVDLPGKRTLFALLTTGATQGDLASMSMEALDPAFRNDLPESAVRIEAGMRVRSLATVKRASYPMLVMFDDTQNPKSVQRVDPDDLAANFGSGVRLKRVTVEITDDHVTTAIDKRLGWLDKYSNRMLDGQTTHDSHELANSLSTAAFWQK